MGGIGFMKKTVFEFPPFFATTFMLRPLRKQGYIASFTQAWFCCQLEQKKATWTKTPQITKLALNSWVIIQDSNLFKFCHHVYWSFPPSQQAWSMAYIATITFLGILAQNTGLVYISILDWVGINRIGGSMSKHISAWDVITFLPKWYLFIYSHFYVLMRLAVGRSWDKQQELTLSCGFELLTFWSTAQ